MLPGLAQSVGYDSIAFDLDGTLVDHASAVEKAFHGVLDDHLGGAADSAERARLRRRFRQIGADLKRASDAMGKPGWDVAEQLAETFAVAAPGNGRIAELSAIFHDRLLTSLRPFADTRALDALSSDFPLALLTNGEVGIQRRKLARSGLCGYFGTVIISGETGWHKPDTRLFDLLCSRLGLPPHRVLFVGDDALHDAMGAHRAGLRAAWLNRTGAPRPPWLPTSIPVVDSLESMTRRHASE